MNNPKIEDIFARVPQEVGESSVAEGLPVQEEVVEASQERVQPAAPSMEADVLPEVVDRQEALLEPSTEMGEEELVSSLERLVEQISRINSSYSDSDLERLAKAREEYCKQQAKS